MENPFDDNGFLRRGGLTRRSFIAASAAAALAACSSSSSRTTTTSGAPSTQRSSTPRGPSTTGASPQARRVRAPGERWDPAKAEGTDLLPQIEHVVVVMMENHSFDNYFGALGRGDGFTIGADGLPTNSCNGSDGKAVRAFRVQNTCPTNNPSQNWNATHTQWNNGAMDGFVRSPSGAGAMGYWDDKSLPFYYSLAKTFPLCDRWFASCMAQTYPNRRFLLAGTARGNLRTNLETLSDPPPPNGTIMEALQRNSISWGDYYTTLPTVGLWLPVATKNGDKLHKIDRFFADAAAGKLPAFSLVEPNFDLASEENPQDISRGEAFAARVINAVMQSPNWARTVLVWCYDEHGGYYDHVAPPAAPKPDDVPPKLQQGDVAGAYDRLGFRVPAVIVSPFARKDYVSHVVHDHTSVLALLEHKYNLPALTHRDGWADDLTDCLDFAGTPFLTPPNLAHALNTKPLASDGTPGPLCTELSHAPS